MKQFFARARAAIRAAVRHGRAGGNAAQCFHVARLTTRRLKWEQRDDVQRMRAALSPDAPLGQLLAAIAPPVPDYPDSTALDAYLDNYGCYPPPRATPPRDPRPWQPAGPAFNTRMDTR